MQNKDTLDLGPLHPDLVKVGEKSRSHGRSDEVDFAMTSEAAKVARGCIDGPQWWVKEHLVSTSVCQDDDAIVGQNQEGPKFN